VLLDSDSIVALMLEKQFGVQAENLVIPTYALDLALTTEDATIKAAGYLASGLTPRGKRRVR